MILTLEVTGAQAGSLGSASRKVFRGTGGSIGRLPSNFWVLPHPYVSSRHALIRYENDIFTIEDTKSSNGIFINSPENRLPLGARHQLKDGDSIFIDPFEIRASVASESVSVGPLPDDPFGADDPFGLPAPAPAAAPVRGRSAPPHHDPMPGEEVDPLNLLGFEDAPEAPSGVPRAADLAGSSVLSDHFAPPPVPTPPTSSARSGPAPLIPEDYNPLLSDDQQSAPAPPNAPPKPAARSTRPAPPPAPADTGAHARPVRPRPTSHGMKRPDLTHPGGTRAGAPPAAPAAPPAAPAVRPARPHVRETPPAAGPGPSPDLAAMLSGAGLDPSAVTPELARSFGQILRVVVSGLMDVLQARQRIKDEFGMRMTTFRPADNNPLKFSANVEDALHNLLVKRNAAYLGPVDAFEDAFGDVRNHQMAMLAGMRVAFESMLAAFDPERLQEEFERQGKKGALITVPAKLRYWDLYREKFGDMVRDAEATFAELFGDEFARAYEEQLERLRARGRPDTR